MILFYKKKEDDIFSGSFVVAGEGYMKVTKVGANTYSSKLADEARKFKVTNSELQNSLDKILKILLFLIVPIGIILAVTQLVFIKSNWYCIRNNRYGTRRFSIAYKCNIYSCNNKAI